MPGEQHWGHPRVLQQLLGRAVSLQDISPLERSTTPISNFDEKVTTAVTQTGVQTPPPSFGSLRRRAGRRGLDESPHSEHLPTQP